MQHPGAKIPSNFALFVSYALEYAILRRKKYSKMLRRGADSQAEWSIL